jgi:glucosyl-dolichyl phosphate glucuronosyltransferase
MESLTACVCTYNRASFLLRLLRELERMHLPDGLRFDIIVVDNASTDDTREIVQEFVQRCPTLFSYVREERVGLSYARNRGLRESKADVVAFLDDDAIPREGWLKATVDGYQLGDDVGAVGGQVLLAFPPHAELPRWFKKSLYPYFSHREIGGEVTIECHRAEDDPYGANISFLRSLALSLGGFNVNLGRQGKKLLGGEETQLCEDIRRAGFRVLLQPESKVDHFVPLTRISLKYLFRQAWCDGQVASIWTIGEHSGLSAMEALRSFLHLMRIQAGLFSRMPRGQDQLVIFFYQFVADLSTIFHRWSKRGDIALPKPR